MPDPTLSTATHLLLHAAVSASAALIPAILNLPVLTLQGIHTYIHPDNPGNDSVRAAIRRTDASSGLPSEPKRRSRSKDNRFEFDESKAQLLRLRLIDSHLQTRLFFPEYRNAFIFSSVALSNLALRLLLVYPDPDTSGVIFSLAALLAASHVLLSLAKLSSERSASRRSEKQLSLIAGLLGFLSVLLIAFSLSPSVFDFKLGTAEQGFVKAAVAALAGCLAGLLFVPAARAARSFWLGTDQLRWNLSVVSCGVLSRFLLYVTLLLNVAAPLLWINPVAVVPALGEVRPEVFD